MLSLKGRLCFSVSPLHAEPAGYWLLSTVYFFGLTDGESRALIVASQSLDRTEYVTEMSYYEEDDLGRFGEVGRHRPDLFEKFMAWYQACQEDGALSRREKALIGLAVAHALQCPYCIDAYSQSCLEAGSNLEQMTEAIHMASALRGGASLVHGVQAHNSVGKVSM